MGNSLDGRRIVVTGASSGIGEATARAIVAEGGRVALLARRAERLDELADELGAVAAPCDVVDASAVRSTIGDVGQQLGGIDGLVNAAGLLRGGSMAASDPADWRLMFEVNVLGLMHATQAAIPHLQANPHGDVVNLSSMSGRRLTTSDTAAYAATKAAVHMLSEGMRQELAPDGIRVSVVAPGFVRTNLFDTPDDEVARRLAGRVGEVGLPVAVVADAIVHVLGSPWQVVTPEIDLLSIAQ